jgi:hypothetical protein
MGFIIHKNKEYVASTIFYSIRRDKFVSVSKHHVMKMYMGVEL